MESRRSQHEGRAKTRTSREKSSQVDRCNKSPAAHHRRRYISKQNRALYFSCSAAAPSGLGPKEILRHMRTSLRSASSLIRSPLTEAVILMAGFGSRVGGAPEAVFKPLVLLGGWPLG